MSHALYPQPLDIERKLFSAGLWTYPASTEQSLIDLTSIAGAAVNAWEQLTGYTPFLADTVDTTWYFNTDGSRCVDLKGGFTSITSVSVNGQAATLNTDYRKMPLNGGVTTYLQFDSYYGRFWSLFSALPAQSAPIAVVGKRGRVATLNEAQWQAILALAAMDVAVEVERLFADGSIKSWKSGTTEEVYNINPFATLIAGWQRVVDRALKASGGYRRAQIG